MKTYFSTHKKTKTDFAKPNCNMCKCMYDNLMHWKKNDAFFATYISAMDKFGSKQQQNDVNTSWKSISVSEKVIES